MSILAVSQRCDPDNFDVYSRYVKKLRHMTFAFKMLNLAVKIVKTCHFGNVNMSNFARKEITFFDAV